MYLGERALLGPAESPDPPREVLAENGAGVRHLLELENPGLLLSRQRLSSFDRPGLCIVHIVSSGKGKPLGSVPEERLTKSFRCADAGVVCRKKVTGETEDEVLEKAVEHARKKHGVDLTASVTLVKFAQSAVRDEDRAANQEEAQA